MRAKILNPWNHDRVVDSEEWNLAQARINVTASLKIGPQLVFDRELGDYTATNNLDDVIAHIVKELSLLKVSKLIKIGPATLESLVDETPKSYECVQTGHLPFDNMFFDFAEPHELAFPFSGHKTQAIGMHLYKTDTPVVPDNTIHNQVNRKTLSSHPYYQVNLYCLGGNNRVYSIRVSFSPKNPSVLCGEVALRNDTIKYAIDANLRLNFLFARNPSSL